MNPKLFSPFELGPFTLANRMVMAPMTRNRATSEGVPTPIMAEYYRQRASAGLIIGESSPVSSLGVGYPNTPGLFTPAQVAGWVRVVNAVHSAGGRIFAQLQHCGRVSHPSHHEDSAVPVAPSAIAPQGHAVTFSGMQPYVKPRALTVSEIKDAVQEFKAAAENALATGFDGVEIHGANGYLIDQFLRDGTNHRQDDYGGSVGNRMRFLNEVLDAVLQVYPAAQVGVRLTPENSFNSMSDSSPQKNFGYISRELSNRGLAYLHVLEGDMGGAAPSVDYQELRSAFGGVYIANNGYDRTRAANAISSGTADLVSFGIPFLANPDLIRRYREGLPLNTPDHTTFYGGDAVGYTDYPMFAPDVESAA